MKNERIIDLAKYFKVRPLPPVKKRITLKTALKAFGLFCTFTGSGLLGYKLFVELPLYNGPTRDLQNKPIVITQPCAKISRELVYNLAKQGSHLILADNHWDKCEELKDHLLRKFSVKSDMIECRHLELDSMLSIRRFAAGILSDFSQLDSVIIQPPSSISGIISGKRRLTHDGFEKELGINYFATYLLSRLFINRLNESNGRLILVIDTKSANIEQENIMKQSGTSQITLPLDNINWDHENSYTPENAYRRAQWFLLMFADELARRNSSIQGNKASILVTNPIVTRGLTPDLDEKYNNTKGILKLIYMLMDICPHLISRKTSNTTLYCATVDSPTIDIHKNDHSMVNCAPIYQDLRLSVSSKQTMNQTIDNRRQILELLWRLSEKWTRLDTHPNALPLPNRQFMKMKKENNNDSQLLDSKVETISSIHV
ncbi:putative short chain dehydrogenase [Schistosoma mansoni]|uniref:putative short chain dehydrogenase n=1 Tax=Schistosoma mansoni TaxID=6183 RepID=UPI0001A6445C|nr:putative short chain dehydrogenase [Schistosoma mansoni]|eukprot:XP_018654428.1 putative short chain dehydrogenase [Schistosoma mansoni]